MLDFGEVFIVLYKFSLDSTYSIPNIFAPFAKNAGWTLVLSGVKCYQWGVTKFWGKSQKDQEDGSTASEGWSQDGFFGRGGASLENGSVFDSSLDS